MSAATTVQPATPKRPKGPSRRDGVVKASGASGRASTRPRGGRPSPRFRLYPAPTPKPNPRNPKEKRGSGLDVDTKDPDEINAMFPGRRRWGGGRRMVGKPSKAERLVGIAGCGAGCLSGDRPARRPARPSGDNQRAAQEKHKAPDFPGPSDQGNGQLAIASAVACCAVRHSLASPRRGTYELSPIAAEESSGNQAKAVQNRPADCRKVFWANNMRYIHSFSGTGMFSDANPVQPPKRHRNHHVPLCPVPFPRRGSGSDVPVNSWCHFSTGSVRWSIVARPLPIVGGFPI